MHCTTAAVADVVAEGLHVPRARIAVIPWGIPPLLTREPVEVDDLVPRSVERSSVARGVDGPRKGISDLLAAFAQRTQADELIDTSQMFDHPARVRSFEIAAQVAMG